MLRYTSQFRTSRHGSKNSVMLCHQARSFTLRTQSSQANESWRVVAEAVRDEYGRADTRDLYE